MSSPNPSPRTIPIWLLIGAALGVAVLVTARLWPTDRAHRLATGLVALALLAISASYSARKALFISRLGSLHAWMIGHVVLGVVLTIAVAAHAGLTEIGTRGWITLGLLSAQVVSGCWGIAELSLTPRRFSRFVNDDFTFPGAARHRLNVLSGGVERALRRRSQEFVRWFETSYQAVLVGQACQVPPCEGFPSFEARAAEDLHGQVAEIARLRALLLRLEHAERVSRRWLHLHVPVTIALVVSVLVHIFGWLYYA